MFPRVGGGPLGRESAEGLDGRGGGGRPCGLDRCRGTGGGDLTLLP